MWSSQPQTSRNKKKKKPSDSPSSSCVLPLAPTSGMEEVWRDINLSTLHHGEIPATNRSSSSSASTTTSAVILQDFLAGPLNKEAPPPPPTSNRPYHHLHPNIIDLNLESCCHLDPNSHGHGVISPNPPLFGFCPNMKRVIERQQMGDGFCFSGRDDDPRHKRMIKNRESAARSRARKQAYTNELELEVAHLVQENSKLRRQFEELRTAMAAQNPAKKTLQRSSSAPI